MDGESKVFFLLQLKKAFIKGLYTPSPYEDPMTAARWHLWEVTLLVPMIHAYPGVRCEHLSRLTRDGDVMSFGREGTLFPLLRERGKPGGEINVWVVESPALTPVPASHTARSRSVLPSFPSPLSQVIVHSPLRRAEQTWILGLSSGIVPCYMLMSS